MADLLTPAQIETLTDLIKCFRNMKYVLIGGVAVKLQFPVFFRDTDDVDLFVTIDLENFLMLDTLLAGWKHSETAEQRWTSPSGLAADIIPVCTDLMDGNFLVWPKTGQRMNLTGYQLAYEHSLELEVVSDITVPVCQCHIIVLLKIIAYMDKPFNRIKDLEDIVLILAKYIPEFDDRYWPPLDIGINYRSVPAFTVGTDLKNVIGPSEKTILDEFIERIKSENDNHLTQANLLKAGHKLLHYTDDDIYDLFDAFAKGLL